jgi:hypothetical protein
MSGYLGSQADPAFSVVAVTPNDSADVAGGPFRGICFAAAGDLAVVTADGDTVTITSGALAAGVIHPIRIKRVKNTGTTATGIFLVK